MTKFLPAIGFPLANTMPNWKHGAHLIFVFSWSTQPCLLQITLPVALFPLPSPYGTCNNSVIAANRHQASSLAGLASQRKASPADANDVLYPAIPRRQMTALPDWLHHGAIVHQCIASFIEISSREEKSAPTTSGKQGKRFQNKSSEAHN